MCDDQLSTLIHTGSDQIIHPAVSVIDDDLLCPIRKPCVDRRVDLPDHMFPILLVGSSLFHRMRTVRIAPDAFDVRRYIYALHAHPFFLLKL